MDASRRHETPGSETKDFMVHSTASRVSIMFVMVPLPTSPTRGHADGSIWIPGHEAGCVTGEEH